MAARWSERDLKALRPGRSAAAIARQIGRSERAVRARARKDGVTLREPRRRRRPPARSIYARIIEAFIATFLTHTEDQYVGRPFTLEGWQRTRIIDPIFGTVDANGQRLYREAVIGLPRNGGKSEIAAAICLALMFTEPVHKGKYVVVARNRAQARIVFDKARSMVYASPELRAWCEVQKHKIIVKETGAEFFTVAYDAGGAQGIHAQVCVIDEYHVHRDDTMRHAMLSGMVGRPGALLVTISTAGDDRKGPLWELLKTAQEDPRAYVCWIGATDDQDANDPRVWREANPQSWVSDDDLRTMYDSMPLAAFERYHLNRFPSRGTNRAFAGAVWHACSDRPRIDDDLPAVIGLDASWTRDTTALVFDQVDGEGWHNVLAWVWRRDEALGYIDHEPVEAKIVELCEDFFVTRIACDPNYFTRSMLRLQNEYGLPVEEFRQNDAKMSAAAMMLLDVLKEGRMRHGGHVDLTDHVLNAGVKETPHGWRITKVQADLKIDAAVALVMAAYLAEAEALTSIAPRVITV